MGRFYLSITKNWCIKNDEMIGKMNVSLSHGELIKFKPITESLKFIKQANRDTVLLANPNLEILFHNDEIVITHYCIQNFLVQYRIFWLSQFRIRFRF